MSEYLERIKELTKDENYDLKDFSIERFLIYINRKLMKGIRSYDLNPNQLEYYINELKEDRKRYYNRLDIDIEYLDKKYRKIIKKRRKSSVIFYKYRKFTDLYDKGLYKESFEELKKIEEEEQ